MDHQSGRKQIASPESALASEIFDLFCSASTLKSILGHFRHLCDILKIKPNAFNQFYPKLKSKLRSWKAQALWKKFDQRANHKCYNRGKACPNTRVLIIGGGPCGLRTAIEAQLLGAKVVVVEKRDRVTRNNVLHLWPFVIHDLRSLGAKKFFGKFCAGAIDHISIRQLQCILLKVSLLLGVEFHENVSFDCLLPPSENQQDSKIGWRAQTTPSDHPVSQYEFDVLIGADGKRNTLEGFKRKEFRGKLAIAITANFMNKKTEAEARVEEISGVAFIFNQKFFKELYHVTGIDLENIVYYKDDTHYFVMTAKKHSLIDKGVILQDYADTARLLAMENVNREALMQYATEAAEFSTEYQMTNMQFAVNHYGQPDVAMFDFTSMYAAENASRVLEQKGHRLLMILVGDSLLEPFWPTGSGCARGFLSSMDACWAIKGWSTLTPLEVLAERESIYRLLGQTTPENLNRDYAAYTLDPHTRYPNLNNRLVTPIQVRGLLDTDDPDNIEQPSILPAVDIPKKRRRRDIGTESQVHPDVLLHWLRKQVALYDNLKINDMGKSFKDGMAICAIIHRYRPDLIDYQSLKIDDVEKNNQLAFDILEKELGITPILTGDEMATCDTPDKLAMFSYLTQIYETFRGEIPHIKHPKLEPEKDERPAAVTAAMATGIGLTDKFSQLTAEEKIQLLGRINKQQDSNNRSRNSRSRHQNNDQVLPTHSSNDKKTDSISRRSRKRRSTDKIGATLDERRRIIDDIENNRNDRMMKRKYLRKMATQQFYKSIQMLQANAKREKDEPFEDYSIFLYRQTAPDFKDRVKELEMKILYPDRDPKVGSGQQRGGVDEEFFGRIKNIEDKLRGTTSSSDKKPRDLLRAIGKIERSDWNVKEIEKKIEENKMGRGASQQKVERVPKWSREQNSKAALVLPARGGSEMCHFCNKRVYLMERLSAEGKFFHRGCFRCEYCSTSLRIGSHMFDRDKNGGRFYCSQHFGLSGTMKARIEKKKIVSSLINKENIPNISPSLKTPEKAKTPLEGVVGLDLLDRGQTPERIEFENLAGLSDAEEAHSQMDEDEWTDRNFGASTAEIGSSDEISGMSDSDEENEVFEEALDQPLTTEGTLELAKNWTLRYSHPHTSAHHSDSGSNEYEDSSDEYTTEDEESGTATEDEDEVRARELRKQEVWLEVPPGISDTDTGSDTEVASDDDSVEESDENSATEISTDSEFEHDGTTPTQHEIPEITINDKLVRKSRGNYAEAAKKVQIKSHVISPVNGNLKEINKPMISGYVKIESSKSIDDKIVGNKKKDTKKAISAAADDDDDDDDDDNNFDTNLKKILKTSNQSPIPLINPRRGDYLLNRTNSTEGIASKLSLELKKRYLLGSSGFTGSVIKSGSTSNVDTKLRSFTDVISQHQKLLNPAHEPSPTMQAFLQGTNKLRTTTTTNNVQSSSIPQISLANKVTKLSEFENAEKLSREETVFDKSSLNENDNGIVVKDDLPDLLKETKTTATCSSGIIMKSKTEPNIHNMRKDYSNMMIVDDDDDKILFMNESLTKDNNETLNIDDDDDDEEKVKEINRDEKKKNLQDDDNLNSDIDFRPRSPLHETSIIVPDVDWIKETEKNKNKKKNKDDDAKESDSSEDSEIDSDSLSTIETDEFENDLKLLKNNEKEEKIVGINLSPPRLEIHNTSGELLSFKYDEEEEEEIDKKEYREKDEEEIANFEPDSIECVEKNFTQEKDNENDSESCSKKIPLKKLDLKNIEKLFSNSDGSPTSSPVESFNSVKRDDDNDDSEENDLTTAALTETEFSEWARDGEGLVSEDLRDVELNINPEFVTTRRRRRTTKKNFPSDINKGITKDKYDNEFSSNSARIAKEEDDLTDFELDIDLPIIKRGIQLPVNHTSKLLANGDNIDFMDTDNESVIEDSLRDATNAALLKNRGYIEFVNVKASPHSNTDDKNLKKDFLNEAAPIAVNEFDHELLISDEEQYRDDKIINIKPITMEDVKERLEFNKKMKDINNENDYDYDDESNVNKNEALESMEEDSLLVVEPAEDTTTSEIITVLASPINAVEPLIFSKEFNNDIEDNERTTIAKVPTSASASSSSLFLQDSVNNPDYLEYVKRLKSRIAEFSNAKDSIDVRKGRRKLSKNNLGLKSQEFINEEIKDNDIIVVNNNNNSFNSPATSRKLEEITRERSKQKYLIQDILMDKLQAHKLKSAEKKAKRAARASSFSPGSIVSSPVKPYPYSQLSPTPSSSSTPLKFIPTSIKTPTNSPVNKTFAEAKKALDSESREEGKSPLSHLSLEKLTKIIETEDNKSNIKIISDDEFKTPKAPPRLKHDEAKRTAEKAKQDARARARLKSDEDLGLSPEDRIKELRLKIPRRQISVEGEDKVKLKEDDYDDDDDDDDDDDLTTRRRRHYSFGSFRPTANSKLQTSKSTDNVKYLSKQIFADIEAPIGGNAKSLDDLLKASEMNDSTKENDDPVTIGKIVQTVNKRDKQKKSSKDPERRRSIIQAVSDFFKKKETNSLTSSATTTSNNNNNNNKDKFSRFRLTGKGNKEKGKIDKLEPSSSQSSSAYLYKFDNNRPKSVCEGMLVRSFINDYQIPPPPVPPPPIDYNIAACQLSDDTLSEEDSKATAVSVNHQTQRPSFAEDSCSSIPRNKEKTAKRIARQTQLKRLRMAQEIQRKLEETEVKQRELESRGVSVEKALRGEGESSDREEADLLREWFDLMRERTELRRYEKELLVRAQEVQLEDRHDRLQQELRERLADDDEKKTSADVKKEGEILTEMLEIVAKRDSLIALLEEERQRYQDEDRDLEAQMLAKGLRLTPIKKTTSP